MTTTLQSKDSNCGITFQTLSLPQSSDVPVFWSITWIFESLLSGITNVTNLISYKKDSPGVYCKTQETTTNDSEIILHKCKGLFPSMTLF